MKIGAGVTNGTGFSSVIPVKTGIQKVLKSQFLWAPAFAGATNQSSKCFFMS